MIKAKAFIWSVLLILVSSIAFSKEKPNIVFILADDVNRDTWGVYGSTDCKTPNIDKLAASGIRFDRAYCTVAMCAPFRQELYSGRTPWRTTTLANHSTSVKETKSIPHYLQPLGYRVALIGKKHFGPESAYPFEYLGKGGSKTEDLNPVFVEKSTAFIDSCTKKETPFCLFIASNDGHGPYTTGDPSRYDSEKLTIPSYWSDTKELREALVPYYAEITNFDNLVGQMKEVLEKRGLLNNTILIVCSEQGTGFPFAKWTCFENGLHMGMVVHWPEVIKPGSVSDELITIGDVTPTLIDAAGSKLAPGDCDGKSFLSILKGEDTQLHEYVYGAFTNCNILDNRTRVYPIRSIRTKQFALMWNPNYEEITSNVTLTNALKMVSGDEKEYGGVAPSWVRKAKNDPRTDKLVHKLFHRPQYGLYDLQKDPYEMNNVYNDPEYKSVAKELKKQLHTKLEEWGDTNPIATEKGLIKAQYGK